MAVPPPAPIRLTEGDRVRLKADAPLRRQYPALAGAIGVVSSVVRGPRWGSLAATPAERARDTRLHVRFEPPTNLVALNVEAEQFEAAEQIEPRAHARLRP